MAKVSVIMPAYNVEQYIEKSIKSVMTQTMEDIELVVVNDASTDNTWEKICEQKKLYGDKITGINLEQNVRQGGARNRGIQAAKGEFICFVDSDDWIKEDMIQKFYDAMIEHNADLVGTGSYNLYYNDEKIIAKQGDKRLVTEISNKEAFDVVKNKYYFLIGGLWCNLYRKSIIIENDIWFPEGLSYEDNYFVNLYFGYVKKYICVNEAFYFYRQNENSTVHRKDMTQLHRIEIEKMLLNEYKKRGLYDAVKDGYDLMSIQRWYINTLGVLFGRFGKESIGYAKEIAKEFRTYYPNYKKNKYYKAEIKKSDRIKLQIFEISPTLLYLIYKLRNR